MKTRCSKPQGAARQLDVAIDLLFADVDPLAIRTLAGAAHGVFADLVDGKKPGGSWRSKMVEASGLSTGAALKVINHAQNFLKHADRDPEAELEIDEEENEHLMFFVTLECGELGYPLSLHMQAFQIWYLALHPDQVGTETDPVKKSRTAFPDLHTLPREQQLRRGAAFLKQVIERRGPNHVA